MARVGAVMQSIPSVGSGPRPWLWGYGLAAGSAGAAAVVHWALSSWTGDSLRYPLFYAAVMISGWYGGLGPGLVATLLGGLLGALTKPVPGSPVPEYLHGAIGFVTFAVVGGAISLLIDQLQRSRSYAEACAQEASRHAMQARQGAEQFRLLVEGLKDYAVLMLDCDGRVVNWNRGAEQLTGYATEEILGHHFARLFSEEDQAAGLPEEELRQAERQGSVGQERWYVRKDGTRYWGSGVTTALRDESGALLGFVKLRRDLTERRLSEEALRRSEDHLRMTTDAVPALIAYVDWQQRCCLANRQHEEWFARPRSEILGKQIVQVMGEEAYEVIRPHVQLALSGRHVSYETVLRFGDGKTRHIRVAYIPDMASDGRVRGFVSFISDITEHKQAEAERARLLDRDRRSRAHLEAMNQIGQMLSAGLDLQKLLQAVTDTARELAGAQFGLFLTNWEGEKADGKPWIAVSGIGADAVSSTSMESHRALFAPTLRGEGAFRSDDLMRDARITSEGRCLFVPDSRMAMASYLAVPVVSRSGPVLGGLFFGHARSGVFTDREERIVQGLAAQAAIAIENVRLFEQLKQERNAAEASRMAAEEASRAKDEFLAVVSHELRTPLTAILGWSRLLTAGHTDEVMLTEGLDTIQRNAQAQAQLIDDLLDMSRIISGRLRLESQRVELSAIIAAAVDSMRPAADAKQIRIEHDLTQDIGPPIRGDANRLQQVVWNLLSNAIKFTPAGGVVRVAMRRVEEQIEINVSDSGKGISADFLPYVFDRFTQADGSTTRRHGGLGLGLSIVKHLVELHGGTVRASSDGEGLGATFTVLLPASGLPHENRERRRPTAVQRKQVSSSGCDMPQLEGLRVLLVDDEKDARTMIKRVLEQCRAQVTAVDSAGAALQTIQDGSPDVLISDISMPAMDGYTLIRRIREAEGAGDKTLPAIALTAFARAEDRAKALDAGFQTHISKPVEPLELVTLVANLTGRACSSEAGQCRAES